MYGSNPFFLFHLVRWVFQKTIEFFSRTVEVFLHYRFGRRHLVGRWGVASLVLQATVLLVMGVFLRAPYELTMKALRFDPSAADVRGLVDRTTPGSIDMRGTAAETLDALKDTYVLDDSLGWGGYYGQLFYREAMQAVSLPFVMFLGGFLALGWYHQGLAERSDEVNDFAGHSQLRSLLTGWSADTITSRVEPLLVIALALLAWGYLPGSRLHVPLSLDADPVLGHYLLVAGVCLAVKENLRLASARQKDEDTTSRQRKMGRDPKASGEAGEAKAFWPVRVDLEQASATPALADAYAALPDPLAAMLSGRPPSVLTATAPGSDGESGSIGTPPVARVACPGCGKVYELHQAPPPDRGVRCAQCGLRSRFRDFRRLDSAPDQATQPVVA